jgi:uncharacterized protein
MVERSSSFNFKRREEGSALVKTLEGIGIGLRTPFAEALLESERPPDWLEIIPENWMFYGGKKRRLLRNLAQRFTIIPHSVSLNVGGVDPLDERFLGALAELTHELDAPLFSDHVCFASTHGRPLHELLPLPLTREAAEVVGRRARLASARVGRPLVLENATFYVHMPAADEEGRLDEGAFMSACLELGGATLLLDVNNVYVNSKNHGFDARAFIDAVPFEKVSYLHLAGHTLQGDTIIDTHIKPIIDDI